MATQWEVKAREFGNCNCSYGCPCQFSALPTHGSCEAAIGYQIDEGYYGDVRLDGLRAAGIYQWPGAVHEGNGTMRLIIDERADDKQRDALEKIMTGQDTKEASTVWWVYATMSPNRLETLFKPIEFEVDIDKRQARLVVDGVVESVGEPIVSPVNGQPHRARIDLPHGFEYRIAEIGSGSTKATNGIELDLKDSFGLFANIHLSHAGVVG